MTTLLPEAERKAREQLFIDLLFTSEVKGNIKLAAEYAGYAKTTNMLPIVARLKDKILAASELFLAVNTPRASMELVGILDNPTEPGTQNTLAALKEVLDRGGVVKKDTVEVKTDSHANITILIPGKKEVKYSEIQDDNSKEGILQE